MKTLYFDLGMGAAGDMLTGALLELMPDREAALEQLNRLGLPHTSWICSAPTAAPSPSWARRNSPAKMNPDTNRSTRTTMAIATITTTGRNTTTATPPWQTSGMRFRPCPYPMP